MKIPQNWNWNIKYISEIVILDLNLNVTVHMNTVISNDILWYCQWSHAAAQGCSKDTSLLVGLVLLLSCTLSGLLQNNESHLNKEQLLFFKLVTVSLQKFDTQ